MRTFNQEASGCINTVVLCISAALPFAPSHFCAAEGLKDVISLATFRDTARFAKDSGVQIIDSALLGLNTRAIVVLVENNKELHSERVEDISEEPDYTAAQAMH